MRLKRVCFREKAVTHYPLLFRPPRGERQGEDNAYQAYNFQATRFDMGAAHLPLKIFHNRKRTIVPSYREERKKGKAFVLGGALQSFC